MTRRVIYLDGHATTPLDPQVLEAMLPWFRERFANPASSLHEPGRQAADAVESAREEVAALIGAKPREIVFTSGATESNNLALRGGLAALRARGDAGGLAPRLLTNAAEHKAVLEPSAALARERAARVEILPVDRHARVETGRLAEALAAGAGLVSIMAANNEVGSLQPMPAIGRLCREAGARLHCDAAQAVGRIAVDVAAWGVDLLSLSGHKMHGPKGSGALFVRGGADGGLLLPIGHGGGHEAGLRPGTVNVPAVVGLGAAARLAGQRLEADGRRIETLRRRLQSALLAALPGVTVNGDPEARLPHNLHLTLDGVDAEALAYSVPELAMSTGSACASADGLPSHVLLSMGLSAASARSSLRLGLTRETTAAEVDMAAELLVAAVRRLRSLSPLSPG